MIKLLNWGKLAKRNKSRIKTDDFSLGGRRIKLEIPSWNKNNNQH
jgi:hypothetical protein